MLSGCLAKTIKHQLKLQFGLSPEIKSGELWPFGIVDMADIMLFVAPSSDVNATVLEDFHELVDQIVVVQGAESLQGLSKQRFLVGSPVPWRLRHKNYKPWMNIEPGVQFQKIATVKRDDDVIICDRKLN
jgi:hypothetical protein